MELLEKKYNSVKYYIPDRVEVLYNYISLVLSVHGNTFNKKLLINLYTMATAAMWLCNSFAIANDLAMQVRGTEVSGNVV